MDITHDTATDSEVLTALALARKGTAYFERALGSLSDEEFDAPSLLPGWSRRHVIAHVGFNAQGIRRLAEWAATGVEHPMYASPAARTDEIDKGTALTASELRGLTARASEALDLAWRGLTDDAWHSEVRTMYGVPIPATKTIWMRTREVWLHTVDLDSGASYDDFPAGLIDHLLADVLSTWRGRQAAEGLPNVVLAPTDRDTARAVGDVDDPAAVTLRGTATNLARWATGRGSAGVATASGDPVPEPARWL